MKTQATSSGYVVKIASSSSSLPYSHGTAVPARPFGTPSVLRPAPRAESECARVCARGKEDEGGEREAGRVGQAERWWWRWWWWWWWWRTSGRA